VAPNFVIAAVAGLLLFSGWKGASLINVLRGGEADQGGTASGATSPGGVDASEGGGAGATIAGGSPSRVSSGKGGFKADPGTNYTAGQEPVLANRLNVMGAHLGVLLKGISGYRSPAHSVAVGGFADDPHTRGEASDTQGTENIPKKVLNSFGLERPFPGAREANHIQLLHSVNQNGGY
jgi:hypothetical protein